MLGTVDLFDDPPLNPDDEFEFTEELGVLVPDVDLSFTVDLLLAPPLKLLFDELDEGLVFVLDPGLVENVPDLTDVLGALPEDFAA